MSDVTYCPPNVDCPCYAALTAENEKLRAEIERLRAALEAVDEALNDAAQDDCESGVKWLNERAAEKYLKEYPHTSAAISKVIGLTRTALEKSRE